MAGGTYTEIAGGSITEIIEGDYNIYAGRNIITSAPNGKITETGVEKGVSYGDPEDPPDMNAKSIPYYFTRDGKYIGDDNETENEVYVADSKTVTSNKDNTKTTTFNNEQDLHITYSDFQEAVSIIVQEGDSQDPDEYKMLASIFYNHAGHNPDNLIATLKKESSVYKNGNPKLRFPPKNNSIPVLSSRQGLIYQLLGGKDLTGGATQNDGNDFFAWGLTKGPFHGGKHAKFIEYKEIIIPKEIFDKATTMLQQAHPSGKITFKMYHIYNIPVIEGVFLDKNNFDKAGNFDYTKGLGKKKLIATAFAGETIYWKVE